LSLIQNQSQQKKYKKRGHLVYIVNPERCL